MTQPIVATIELTGQNKTGTSMKSGAPKPWWRLGAYVQVPGLLHPQAIEFFTSEVTQVQPAGKYEAPCVTRIQDGNILVQPDLSQLKPVTASRAA